MDLNHFRGIAQSPPKILPIYSPAIVSIFTGQKVDSVMSQSLPLPRSLLFIITKKKQQKPQKNISLSANISKSAGVVQTSLNVRDSKYDQPGLVCMSTLTIPNLTKDDSFFNDLYMEIN